MNLPTESGWYWFSWNEHIPEAVLWIAPSENEEGYFLSVGIGYRHPLSDWIDPEVQMLWRKLEVPND